MSTAPSLLFTPITVGRLRLRSRLVMAPMGTNFGNAEGFPGEKLINYVEARARGGVGRKGEVSALLGLRTSLQAVRR